ncbi:hypothetical protein [Paenibacillus thiaminolyticus]|nr:hypothetical protein [Paenibacillus thiaminolyticus]WII37472.1 hypothetical protein O0V01_28505 [Paenibacillus thiaminolyticus]
MTLAMVMTMTAGRAGQVRLARRNPALVQQFTRYESISAEIAAKVH